jgi:hypothetical protein
MANNFNIGSLTGALGAPILYPLINGFRPSWASIEFQWGSTINYALQSIDYKAVRTRKKTRGTNVDPFSKTRGSADYDCKIKVLLSESDAFMAQLAQQDPTGQGAYGDVFFMVTVKYAEPSMAIITDTILGCTIDSIEQSSSEGVEDIVREHELSPLLILHNGRRMSSQLLGAPQY